MISPFPCSNSNICISVILLFNLHCTDRYEISISQMTRDLLLFPYMFSFRYNSKDFHLTWLYIRVHDGCLISSRNYLPFRVHLWFPGVLRVAYLVSLLCCLIMCPYVLSSVLLCPLRFPHKTVFGSSLLPVVCKRAHVIFTLLVFVCA